MSELKSANFVKSENPKNSRFTEIDSLRFIACAAVIIQHALTYFSQFSTKDDSLERIILILSPGWIGVLTFFSISGFVIPSSLKGPKETALKVFFKRRFWRLYPPFWIACITIILIDPHKYSVTSLLWRASMLPVVDRNVLGHSSYFWTLHIELVFYFFISFLFLLFGSFTWKPLIALLSIIMVPYATWVCISGEQFAPFFSFYQSIPFSILLMLWGGCCRAVLDEDNSSKLSLKNNYSRAIKVGLTTGLLTIIPLHAVYFGASEWSLWQLHQGSATTLGIFIFLFGAVLTPVKSSLLARLGRNTYSTYLFHGAVNLVLFSLFKKIGYTNWPLPAILIIVLLCSFTIGELFYRLVEIPSNALGKHIKRIP